MSGKRYAGAAWSVFCSGIYLALLGGWRVSFPNVLLKLFGLPATNEVWIRVVGVLVLVMAFFSIQFVRKGLREAFRLTIHGRLTSFIFRSLFVFPGFVKPVLLLFGLVDLSGALWTAATLRSVD